MATAAQIASAGVYVTDDVGVEVTDGASVRVQLGLLPSNTYGLRVIAADGTTVIIDGTSDMFRIAASGTGTVTITGVGVATTTVTISGSGLPGQTPAFLGFIAEGITPATNAHREIGKQQVQNQGFVAPTSGASPINGSRYVRYEGGAFATSDGTNPQIVVFTNCGETALVSNWHCRFYLLQQVGI